MAYSFQIGLRYLRSKKRFTVSLITVIAISAVSLGVAALLSVLSITGGFQDAFRNKVLGVNAHVLVLKYGLDFDEYRDVIARARELPEVAGAAPFVINEMMLAKGDRVGGVLVKGVDPELMPTVLDLPSQMVAGSLEGLRRPGAVPPLHPDQLGTDEEGEDLDTFLRDLAGEDGEDGEDGAPGAVVEEGAPPGEGAAQEALTDEEMEALRERIAATGGRAPVVEATPGEPAQVARWTPVWERGGRPERAPQGPAGAGEGEVASGGEGEGSEVEPLPVVEVPSLDEAEAALAELELSEGLPDDERERLLFEDDDPSAEGPRVADADVPGMILGVTLAQQLGIEVGDRVRIISPLAGLDTSMWSPQARTPRSREFRVIGIFSAGFQEYDSRLVYVDLYEAQAFFEQGDTVTGVEIRLHDLEEAHEIATTLERELGGGPFHTMDWRELNNNLFTALEIQKVVLSAVFTTIIVVAAFFVIATLIMIVIEKKREIAILKAMGARDLGVLSIFFIQGTIIGSVGTLIGLVLGGGVVAYLTIYRFPLDPKVYLIDHLPVRVSPGEFVFTIVVALIVCAGATLVPSWWAARMLPADGVRYE